MKKVKQKKCFNQHLLHKKVKKDSFTLIELLAVIVLLAVIGFIATPIIVDVMDEADDKSIKQSMNNVADAAEMEYINFPADSLKRDFDQKDFSYKGKYYENMKIHINDEGSAIVVLYYNNMCYYKNPDDYTVHTDENLSEIECLDIINN